MKQVVLKVNFHDERTRKKIMKTVSGNSGVDSISMDSKDMKLTVTGDVDPVSLVSKLRKHCNADILSVGPPKAPEKRKKNPKKKSLKNKNQRKMIWLSFRSYGLLIRMLKWFHFSIIMSEV
uniref:HMA domain-containing protein n=1 Tax=Cannabis sativa TaxID=3483 RepID=A0A803RA51_CANSA